jgi:hypothetical protein
VCDPATGDLAAAVESELRVMTPPPTLLLDAVLMVFVLSAVPLNDIARFLAAVGALLLYRSGLFTTTPRAVRKRRFTRVCSDPSPANPEP